jgi:hypothetical protein
MGMLARRAGGGWRVRARACDLCPLRERVAARAARTTCARSGSVRRRRGGRRGPLTALDGRICVTCPSRERLTHPGSAPAWRGCRTLSRRASDACRATVNRSSAGDPVVGRSPHRQRARTPRTARPATPDSARTAHPSPTAHTARTPTPAPTAPPARTDTRGTARPRVDPPGSGPPRPVPAVWALRARRQSSAGASAGTVGPMARGSVASDLRAGA